MIVYCSLFGIRWCVVKRGQPNMVLLLQHCVTWVINETLFYYMRTTVVVFNS